MLSTGKVSAQLKEFPKAASRIYILEMRAVEAPAYTLSEELMGKNVISFVDAGAARNASARGTSLRNAALHCSLSANAAKYDISL